MMPDVRVSGRLGEGGGRGHSTKLRSNLNPYLSAIENVTPFHIPKLMKQTSR